MQNMTIRFLNTITFLSAAIILAVSFITAIGSLSAQTAVQTIQIHVKRFSFDPAEITIKKGETVKLVLTSDDVTHSLLIPDLNVNAPVKKGHPAEVTITPSKPGDFQGKCGHFCGTGHGSMRFTVHVKDE